MPIKFVELSEFERDKKHLRKYRHLEGDLLRLRDVLTIHPTDAPGVDEISEKDRKFKGNIYKVRKFYSSDIPNKGSQSGFRIIYHYDNPIETITLIEIYHHNQQKDYDKDRLIRNFPI